MFDQINVTTMGPDHQPSSINNQPVKLQWPQTEEPTNSCSGDDASNHQLQTSLTTKVSELTNSQAKIREESIKKALLLKRKELRWKLMQASQAQNQAKLIEIKTSLNYHKQKLSRAQALAVKLRDKYARVVRSAKVTEVQLATAEKQLASQEKYVADEKMQLTKLAIECINTGTSLYGPSYKLPENNKTLGLKKFKYPGLRTSIQLNTQSCDTQSKPQDGTATQETTEEILKKLSPFLRTAREVAGASRDNTVEANRAHNVVIDQVAPNVIRPNLTTKKRKRTSVSRLSSLYDLNDSVLKNLASYRLTRKFAEIGTTKLTDLAYSHNIHPLEYICLPDLLGECSDKSCSYQHKSNYYMTDLEILTDLLSYRPAVAGWVRGDDDLDDDENYRVCRVKLKQYAAKLISRNADKPIETIARAIVSDIRENSPDLDLLLMCRHLPKSMHLTAMRPVECSCEVVSTQEKNTGDTDFSPEDQSQVVEMDS